MDNLDFEKYLKEPVNFNVNDYMKLQKNNIVKRVNNLNNELLVYSLKKELDSNQRQNFKFLLNVFEEIIQEYENLLSLLYTYREFIKESILDSLKLKDTKSFHQKFIDLIRFDIEIYSFFIMRLTMEQNLIAIKKIHFPLDEIPVFFQQQDALSELKESILTTTPLNPLPGFETPLEF